MNRQGFVSTVLALLLITAAAMNGAEYEYTVKKFDKRFTFSPVVDEVMVKFAGDGQNIDGALTSHVAARLGLAIVHDAAEALAYAVYRVPAGQSMSAVIDQLRNTSGVSTVHQALRDHEGFIKYFIPGEMTIQFDAALGEEIMLATLDSYGLEIKTDHWTPGYYTAVAPAGTDLFALIRAFNELGEVEFAELNVVSFNDFAFTPNDTFYSQQWSWSNTGQNGGTPGADMSVDDAWDIEQGDPNVLVAIIDTGVDWDHEDLQANIWQNPGEDTDGDGTMIWNGSSWVLDPDDLNGVDNDGNGRIDDLIGWDFDSNDNNPDDLGNHGTACAGIAAAVTDNNLGVAGVAGGSRIMPLRVSLISGQNANRADAINYAASFIDDYDGIVLSCSWIMSSGDFSAVENAIINAKAAGVVCCFAAGNFNSSPVSYPARYEDAVAIGGSSPCDDRKSTSSCDGEWWWGASFGDDLSVSAPCVLIYTTDRTGSSGYSPTNYFATFNGTSSACPNAAGVAALIISHYAEISTSGTPISPGEVEDIMQQTADKVGGYNYNYDPLRPGASFELGYGRLNANAALLEVIDRYGDGGGPSIDVSLSLDPQAGSGTFDYDMSFTNTTAGTVNSDIWLTVEGPGGYDDLVFVRNKDFPGNSTRNKLRSYTISGGSTGDYDVTLHSGTYPSVIDDSETQVYSKTSLENGAQGRTAGLEVVPSVLTLEANYPNPFNPETSIRFGVPAAGHAQVSIFNALGEHVTTVVDQYMEAGYHTVRWNGTDASGRSVSSGIYIYRVAQGTEVRSSKMLLSR